MYKAEKTRVTRLLIIIILLSIISLIVINNKTIIMSMRVRSSIVLILTLATIVSLLLFIFIKSLYYKFDDKHLIIGSYLKKFDKYIEYEDILAYDTRVTLINKIGMYAFFGKRFFIGKGNIEGVGKTILYVTNSKKNIYLLTNEEIYAISPKDFDGFVRELEELSIDNAKVYREISEEDILESDEITRRFFLLNIILILIMILIPMALYYTNYLPNHIPLSDTKHRINLYMSQNEYLNRVCIYGALNFIFLIIMTLFSRIYSKSDTLYHYKILFIPLIVAIFRLLFLVNDLVLMYGGA